MKLSDFLQRAWVRHENRRQGRPVSWRRSPALERLEDRTVPSTLPVLGHLPTPPVLGNLSSITSALTAPLASSATGITNSTVHKAANMVRAASKGLQDLQTDLTKTLNSVIADVTDAIKLIGDTANPALAGVANTLTTDVADLKTLLTDVTTTLTDATTTLTDVVKALTSGLTSGLNLGSVTSTLNGVSSSLGNLSTDLATTLNSVTTDLTDAVMLITDTANTTLATVTNTLTADVADLNTLLTDATITVTDATATVTDVVTILTGLLTSGLGGPGPPTALPLGVLGGTTI